MKKLNIISVLAILVAFVACRKSETPIPQNEKILTSVTWKIEGFYINNVKQANTPALELKFNSELLAGVKPLTVNGIPGSSWQLSSTNQLTIFYPSVGITLNTSTGATPSVGNIVLTASTLTNTNFNLTQSTNQNFLGAFQFSANAELRMIPK